jgi:hypothetical protein
MSRRLFWPAALLLFATAPGRADAPPAPVIGIDELLHMSACELEAIYRAAPPGRIAAGYAPGKTIFSPGTKRTLRMAKLAGVVWQGKHFDACSQTITNQVFGKPRITADVAYGESWFDGGPSIVMDYADKGPRWAKPTRDEVREVAPGLFLGLMYKRTCCGPKFVMFFALEACPVE